MAILSGSIISMLSRQASLGGEIDKQVLLAAPRRLIHLPPASLSANNCKNATEMDLGEQGRGRTGPPRASNGGGGAGPSYASYENECEHGPRESRAHQSFSSTPTSASLPRLPYQALSRTRARPIRMQARVKIRPVYKVISLGCGSRNTV